MWLNQLEEEADKEQQLVDKIVHSIFQNLCTNKVLLIKARTSTQTTTPKKSTWIIARSVITAIDLEVYQRHPTNLAKKTWKKPTLWTIFQDLDLQMQEGKTLISQ